MTTLKTATRSVSNAGVRRVVGAFPSRKNALALAWESLIERDYFYDCEFSLLVRRYVPQPETVTLWIDDKSVTYTSDVRVEHYDDSVLYTEVKPDDVADDPEWAPLFEAAERHYHVRGEHYAVCRESSIRRGKRMDNIRLLYRYAGWPTTPRQVETILKWLPAGGRPVALGDLTAWARYTSQDLGVIYHLMFTQQIGADLEPCLIGPEMPVWRAVP